MYSVAKILTNVTGILFQENQEEYKLCCPFHQESDPSFGINYEGKYYCFVCGIHGKNILDFLSQLYNIPVIDPETECVYDLLLRGNYRQPERTIYQRSIVLSEQAAKNLLAAKDYYRGNFHGDASANKDYHTLTAGYIFLYNRGLLATTLKQFRVIDWRLFVHHPVFLPLAFNGECWGYQQRRIREEEYPKYLSMLGQDTSQHVDGYAGKQVKVGLVVEGTLDKMFAWQYGWKEEDGYACFAVIGSHVSEKQAEIMAQHCDIFLSGFDNDTAGDKAHGSFIKAMAPHKKEVIRMRVESQGISKSSKVEFWCAVKQALQEKKQFSTNFQNSSENCYKNDMS